MLVADVMTHNVISVAPGATIKEAINLMLARHISALFVVDQKGDLVGVVSEGDLLRREELGTERSRPWWLRILASPARQASDFAQANGRFVHEVMTRDVFSIAHDDPLENVVQSLERHRIKRLPVTQSGRVVGVVSRADLLRALIGREGTPDETAGNDLTTIRARVLRELEAQAWAPRTTLDVTVADGVVILQGSITSEEERRGLRVVAENVPGVKGVQDHLALIEPYTGTVIAVPEEMS